MKLFSDECHRTEGNIGSDNNAPVPLAGAHTAYEKIDRYAARSPRWFGGTSPAPLFRMCCVSTELRINDAWVTHMWRIWRMNGDATPYDGAYENLTIAYSRRKWRMHSVHPTNARRSTRFYGVWRAYVQRMGCVHAELMNTPHNMWAVNVTFKCPCSWIHMFLNVLFHLSNLVFDNACVS